MVDMTPSEFSEARYKLGFKQRQLAEFWGMGQNGERTIRRWEQGDVPVNPIAARLISAYLNGYRPDDWPEGK